MCHRIASIISLCNQTFERLRTSRHEPNTNQAARTGITAADAIARLCEHSNLYARLKALKRRPLDIDLIAIHPGMAAAKSALC